MLERTSFRVLSSDLQPKNSARRVLCCKSFLVRQWLLHSLGCQIFFRRLMQPRMAEAPFQVGLKTSWFHMCQVATHNTLERKKKHNSPAVIHFSEICGHPKIPQSCESQTFSSKWKILVMAGLSLRWGVYIHPFLRTFHPIIVSILIEFQRLPIPFQCLGVIQKCCDARQTEMFADSFSRKEVWVGLLLPKSANLFWKR